MKKDFGTLSFGPILIPNHDQRVTGFDEQRIWKEAVSQFSILYEDRFTKIAA